MKYYVITPLSIVLIIIIILSALTAINGLFINNEGGTSLGGGIAFVFTILLSGLLALEQVLVKSHKGLLRKIWIVEILLLAVAATILIMKI